MNSKNPRQSYITWPGMIRVTVALHIALWVCVLAGAQIEFQPVMVLVGLAALAVTYSFLKSIILCVLLATILAGVLNDVWSKNHQRAIALHSLIFFAGASVFQVLSIQIIFSLNATD
jgi:hypothetical protein